jgi:hypothetical protein
VVGEVQPWIARELEELPSLLQRDFQREHWKQLLRLCVIQREPQKGGHGKQSLQLRDGGELECRPDGTLDTVPVAVKNSQKERWRQLLQL